MTQWKKNPWCSETANRLRRGDCIPHNGQRYLITEITKCEYDLAILLIDPDGSSDENGHLLLVGENWGTEYERGFGAGRAPYAAEKDLQVRERPFGFQIWHTDLHRWLFLSREHVHSFDSCLEYFFPGKSGAELLSLSIKRRQQAAEAAADASKRFGEPAGWARYHANGPHTCVDGKWYTGSCLVTDPSREHTARYYMSPGYYGGVA